MNGLKVGRRASGPTVVCSEPCLNALFAAPTASEHVDWIVSPRWRLLRRVTQGLALPQPAF
jgi:hypothetical protein